MTKAAKKRTAARSTIPSSIRPKPSKARSEEQPRCGGPTWHEAIGCNRNAALPRWRDDRCAHKSHRLAVAFGAGLSCWGRAQTSQARFGIGALSRESGSIGSTAGHSARPVETKLRRPQVLTAMPRARIAAETPETSSVEAEIARLRDLETQSFARPMADKLRTLLWPVPSERAALVSCPAGLMAEVGLRWCGGVNAAEPKEILMSKQKSKRQTPLRSNGRTAGGRNSLAHAARKATKLKGVNSPC